MPRAGQLVPSPGRQEACSATRCSATRCSATRCSATRWEPARRARPGRLVVARAGTGVLVAGHTEGGLEGLQAAVEAVRSAVASDCEVVALAYDSTPSRSRGVTFDRQSDSLWTSRGDPTVAVQVATDPTDGLLKQLGLSLGLTVVGKHEVRDAPTHAHAITHTRPCSLSKESIARTGSRMRVPSAWRDDRR